MYDIEKMNNAVQPAMDKLELILQKITHNPGVVLARAQRFSGEMSELLTEPADGFFRYIREEDGQHGLVIVAMLPADVAVAASHPQAARLILSARVEHATGKVDQFYMSYFDGRRAREVFPQINPQLAPERILSLLPKSGLSLASLYDSLGSGLVDRLGELVELEETVEGAGKAPVTKYRLGGDARLLSLHPVAGDLTQPPIIMSVKWITDVYLDTGGLPVPVIKAVELNHVATTEAQGKAIVLALCALWQITEIVKRRRDHVVWSPKINGGAIEIIPSDEICKFIYSCGPGEDLNRDSMDRNLFQPNADWVAEALGKNNADLEIP